MNIDNLTFGQIKNLKEILQVSSNDVCNEKEYNGEKVMAFLMKGFIFVGNLESKGDYLVLSNVLNCRYQDKGKGWGYIAENGKDYCTVDEYLSNSIKFHKYQLLFTHPVDEEKWKAEQKTR